MNSLGRECNELKSKYDECFNVWFSQKFLKGDTNDDMCKPLFLVYRDCIRVSTHFNSAMSSLAISSYKNDTDKQWQFILLPGKICDVSSFVTQNYKQMDSDCHSSIRIQYKILGFFAFEDIPIRQFSSCLPMGRITLTQNSFSESNCRSENRFE